MTILGMAGWVLLGAAAWSMRTRREKSTATDATAKPPDPHRLSDEAVRWCAAIASVSGGSAWLLDEGLCSLADGKHLVDVVPREASAELLDGIRRARKDGCATLSLQWEGRSARASFAAMGRTQMLLFVTVEGS